MVKALDANAIPPNSRPVEPHITVQLQTFCFCNGVLRNQTVHGLRSTMAANRTQFKFRLPR